jgi:hypothetical protein
MKKMSLILSLLSILFTFSAWAEPSRIILRKDANCHATLGSTDIGFSLPITKSDFKTDNENFVVEKVLESSFYDLKVRFMRVYGTYYLEGTLRKKLKSDQRFVVGRNAEEISLNTVYKNPNTSGMFLMSANILNLEKFNDADLDLDVFKTKSAMGDAYVGCRIDYVKNTDSGYADIIKKSESESTE